MDVGVGFDVGLAVLGLAELGLTVGLLLLLSLMLLLLLLLSEEEFEFEFSESLPCEKAQMCILS